MPGISAGLGGQVNNNIQTDGLVFYIDAAYKKSYPKAGSTWYDLIGANDTAISNASFNSSGYFELDGTNDSFEVTNDGSSDFAKQTFSIEFWCYVGPTAGNYEIFWSYDYTSHSAPYYAQQWRTGNSDTTLYGGSNKDGVWNSSTGVHDGVSYTKEVWTHLVWTMGDGGSSKTSTFYQDGVSNGTETNTSWDDINYYTQEVIIGNSPNFSTGRYAGYIASVRFYDRDLSLQEVKQNYNAGKERFGF